MSDMDEFCQSIGSKLLVCNESVSGVLCMQLAMGVK